MDVYMKALKDFSGKEIYDLDDMDVLDFLMFKDINDSGRTIIHHHACPNVGNLTLETCPDLVKCSFRHSANSMRVGIVLKLSKAFQEVGRRGTFNKDTMFGAPTNLTLSKNISLINKWSRVFLDIKKGKHLLCPDPKWISL